MLFWPCRIYGMADFQGALWQSDEYKTRSDLLDAAMVEQLKAARADSRASGVRGHHTGLWTSSHGFNMRGRRTSADTVGGLGNTMAFSNMGTHAMPMADQLHDRSPTESSPTPHATSRTHTCARGSFLRGRAIGRISFVKLLLILFFLTAL